MYIVKNGQVSERAINMLVKRAARGPALPARAARRGGAGSTPHYV